MDYSDYRCPLVKASNPELHFANAEDLSASGAYVSSAEVLRDRFSNIHRHFLISRSCCVFHNHLSNA
uniref:Uncharacterized protein n=1 Tax=Syphacia muris TaxID=451379 RepID=A0A0N5AXI2_9BILA